MLGSHVGCQGAHHGGTVLGFSPMDVLVTPLLLPQSRPSGGLFAPSRASVDPLHENEGGDVCERKILTHTVSVKCYPANTPSPLLSPHLTTTPSMIQRSTFGNSHLENLHGDAGATISILYSMKYIYVFRH